MEKLGSKKETKYIRSAVRRLSKGQTGWVHPFCVFLQLEVHGSGQRWDLDDEALLKFGERILEDLRQEKHRHAGIQTPWGDTYNGLPSEVSIKRIQGVIAALRTSREFWSQTLRQAEQWSQQLGAKNRGYLRDFLSSTVEFEDSRLVRYVEFLHRLFTSSRAALLLCMARVEFLLKVAPWGESAPQDYDTLRLRAFQALSNVCLAWHALMQSPWTVAYWARSAGRNLRGHEYFHDSTPNDDDHRYNFPEDMIDRSEQAHFADTQYTNGEYFQSAHMCEAWDFIRRYPTGKELFDDCYSIHYWVRTRAQMAQVMTDFRSVKGVKPFHISVVQDEAAAQMSENDARSCAIQLWASRLDDWINRYWLPGLVTKSLNCLIDAWGKRADDSWWPKDMHNRGEQHYRWGRAHCEAILCQDWVNRRVRYRRSPLTCQKNSCVLLLTLLLKTENPIVRRLPIFGVSRPLCGTCATFLRRSLDACGASADMVCLLVPGTHKAYSTCRMPPGAKEAVVEGVVRALKAELLDALRDPDVQDFFRTLAKSVDGQPWPSPDPSYPDIMWETLDAPE